MVSVNNTVYTSPGLKKIVTTPAAGYPEVTEMGNFFSLFTTQSPMGA
jgi:hypothetical protein